MNPLQHYLRNQPPGPGAQGAGDIAGHRRFARSSGAGVRALIILTVLTAAALSPTGCSRGPSSIDPAEYRARIQEWQKGRETGLMKETGWLTLAGLGWLREGENSVGSDSSNTIVLPPGKAPGTIGSILLSGEEITFRSNGNAVISHNGSPVREIEMAPDVSGDPTILATGTLSFYVIKRGDDLGVRIKDTRNPARLNFTGLKFFPIDLRWRFEATFHPYDPPKFLELPTQAGTVERDSCPGSLSFEIDGEEFRIDAVIESGVEDKLFIMFSDGTSGEETYAVGRQLYAPLPDSNNMTVLDFNQAYNWPCVFTPFATCPIPPRQNAIAYRIEAGEKMYHGDAH